MSLLYEINFAQNSMNNSHLFHRKLFVFLCVLLILLTISFTTIAHSKQWLEIKNKNICSRYPAIMQKYFRSRKVERKGKKNEIGRRFSSVGCFKVEYINISFCLSLLRCFTWTLSLPPFFPVGIFFVHSVGFFLFTDLCANPPSIGQTYRLKYYYT